LTGRDQLFGHLQGSVHGGRSECQSGLAILLALTQQEAEIGRGLERGLRRWAGAVEAVCWQEADDDDDERDDSMSTGGFTPPAHPRQNTSELLREPLLTPCESIYSTYVHIW